MIEGDSPPESARERKRCHESARERKKTNELALEESEPKVKTEAQDGHGEFGVQLGTRVVKFKHSWSITKFAFPSQTVIQQLWILDEGERRESTYEKWINITPALKKELCPFISLPFSVFILSVGPFVCPFSFFEEFH